MKQSSGFGMRSQGTAAARAGAGSGKPAIRDRVRWAGPYARRIRRRLHGRAGHAYHCDLHLEKGSRAASRAAPASADSRDTLHRLKCALEAYRPERVICLGDSFDDCFAGEAAFLGADALSSLCASVDEWIWLGGNHDPETPAFCGGETRIEIEIGGAILRHEPAAACATPDVGHLHPKASVPAGGYRFSGPCFCVSEDLLIMPAFGAYAGGLYAAPKPSARCTNRSPSSSCSTPRSFGVSPELECLPKSRGLQHHPGNAGGVIRDDGHRMAKLSGAIAA